MNSLHLFPFTCILLFIVYCMVPCKALDCQLSKMMNTFKVDKNGKGHFTTVQGAIDSVPQNNNKWIHIQVSPGRYIEKVEIPVEKPCIFLEGAGASFTSVEWGDHIVTANSSTFTSYADSIVVKGIAFKNTFNLQQISQNQVLWKQAVAARIKGDKCLFTQCAFVGVQDTLWDDEKRHYFKGCYIEGAVDFIFGKAQSIYEKCVISVNMGKYAPGLSGFITAQKRETPQMESGFVFKRCAFVGTGKAYLGRAWGPYSTVIIYQSSLSDVVNPSGWNAWNFVSQEHNFTYVEANNRGPGADTSKRVPWEKKLTHLELSKYVNISYINQDGWLSKCPGGGVFQLPLSSLSRSSSIFHRFN